MLRGWVRLPGYARGHECRNKLLAYYKWCVYRTSGATLVSVGMFINSLTPAAAIERLSANDPTLTVCDLSKSAVFQMKGAE